MSIRLQRVAEELHKVLATVLLSDAKDERLRTVSITGVRVSPDMQIAHVHYMILGVDEEDEHARAEVADSLRRARGFLRSQVSSAVRLRKTPELRFHYDESLRRGQDMESLLHELRESGAMGSDESGAVGTDDD